MKPKFFYIVREQGGGMRAESDVSLINEKRICRPTLHLLGHNMLKYPK